MSELKKCDTCDTCDTCDKKTSQDQYVNALNFDKHFCGELCAMVWFARQYQSLQVEVEALRKATAKVPEMVGLLTQFLEGNNVLEYTDGVWYCSQCGFDVKLDIGVIEHADGCPVPAAQKLLKELNDG